MAGKEETDQANEQDYEARESRARLREKVNIVLSDGLMICLALLMVPIVVLPFFFDLPDSLDGFLRFADYAILVIFVVEYVLKAGLSENLKKHVLNSWHLLDLLVIVLPIFDFLPFLGINLGRSSPMLRLLRIARIAAVSGRTVERRMSAPGEQGSETSSEPVIKIRVIDENLENIRSDVQVSEIKDYLSSKTQTWIDISPVSEHYYEELSKALNLPPIMLESKLVDEAYPHIDYYERFSTIYARIGDINVMHYGANRILVERSGLLVICAGQNIITISKRDTKLFDRILDKARKYSKSNEALSVSTLYGILKYILYMDEQIIVAIESELLRLENIPHGKLPSNFLETTFHLKKEVNQLVSSLLHIKEIVTIISSKRVPLDGFGERDEKIFGILLDEATYLHETAQNARENLISLIELYINTNAHETNKVMRVIAVITCLAIIPAMVGGLLGMNLVDNPWQFYLWQVAVIVGAAMFGTAWIFYKMGWLKG